MADLYNSMTPGLTSPFMHAVAVTPNDGASLTMNNGVVRALWIGASGNLTVDTLGGETNVTFTGLPAGWFAGFITKVYNTGTSASSIIAVW